MGVWILFTNFAPWLLTNKHLTDEKNGFRQVFEASSTGASSIQGGDVQPDHDLNVFLFLFIFKRRKTLKAAYGAQRCVGRVYCGYESLKQKEQHLNHIHNEQAYY